MEKKTVVYKRRPRKPLSDLVANAGEVYDHLISLVSTSSDSDGTQIINVENNTRKSWIDRTLSTKGRRRSVSWGVEFNLTGMADEWVGTLFKREDKKHIKCLEGNLRNQPTKKSSVAIRNKKVNPPVEFVMEKQTMFAEIDSFELESEEESPASKARSQEWTKEYSDLSQEVFTQRRCLDIVPEDEFEEFADSLSAALLTPNTVLRYEDNREESSQSSSVESGSSQLSSRSRSWSSKTRKSLSGPDVYNSPIASSVFYEPSVEDYISDAEISIASSDLSLGFEDSPFPYSDISSEECDLLVSGLRSLQLGDIIRKSLISSAEEDEKDHLKIIDNEVPTGTDLRLQSRKISLKVSPEEPLPIFKALLEECHQTQPSSLRDAISDFCDLSEMVKLGEGTFGEAFKGGGCVFKIVPMDGDFLVNAEVQKTAAEIYSEVLLTNTLHRLRGVGSMNCVNYCTNFIETKAIRICQGSYEEALCLAWEEWDVVRPSDNDHPMLFPQHQLYVVFVLADGGKDLEGFVLSDFNEVRSVLLQVVLALAVAEEGCGFEHRDLHWLQLHPSTWILISVCYLSHPGHFPSSVKIVAMLRKT